MRPSDLCARILIVLAAALWQILVVASFAYFPFAGLAQAPALQSDQAQHLDSAKALVSVFISTLPVDAPLRSPRSPPLQHRGREKAARTKAFPIPSVTDDLRADDKPMTPPAVQAAVPVGAADLRCEVHIHQSPNGIVQAIDFGRCTGDAVWQRSLIAIIQQAATLVHPRSNNSAPPVRTLTLETNSISANALAAQLTQRP